MRGRVESDMNPLSTLKTCFIGESIRDNLFSYLFLFIFSLGKWFPL